MIAQVQVHALPTHSISRNYFLFFVFLFFGGRQLCVKVARFPFQKKRDSLTKRKEFFFVFFDSSSKELEEQKDNKKKRVNYLFAQVFLLHNYQLKEGGGTDFSTFKKLRFFG